MGEKMHGLQDRVIPTVRSKQTWS